MLEIAISRKELKEKSFGRVKQEVQKADKQFSQHLPHIAGVIYKLLLIKETQNNGN